MGGGPSRQHESVWDLGVGQNGVVVIAMGKNNGGGGGCCSRWLMWQSWELRNFMVAIDGGGNCGGG